MGEESILSRFTPRMLLGMYIIAICVALGVAIFTSTAVFGAYNPSWDGTSTVRETMTDDSASVEPILLETDEYERLESNNSLVIILAPNQPYSASEINHLQSFLNDGGTVFVADDRPRHTNQLLDKLGTTTRIDGQPLRDPRQFHRTPALPVITDTATTPMFRGVDEITFNKGTVLQTPEDAALANTSEFAYLDANNNQQLEPSEQLRSYPVVAREPAGDGQVIIMSDASVFINQMLDQEGNQAFLMQLIESHSRVALDISHTTEVPFGAALWIWMRQTAWAQALVGGSGIGALWLYTDTRVHSFTATVFTALLERVGRTSPEVSMTFDTDERIEFLQRRHPEWSAKRIERITQNIEQTTDSQSPNSDE